MHHTTHFETRKLNCLSKRDKSSAGRIDPHAVDICAALNKRDEYYTTSSCAGRCFLYCGDGIKSWHSTNSDDIDDSGNSSTSQRVESGKLGFFRRYRVSHDLINDARRYFDLTSLIGGSDPTGGGDPIPTIGQFDNGNNTAFKSKLEEAELLVPATPIWLRFEPFILHVMCRSLKAASVLMALARPSFKNVGLHSWNNGGVDENSKDEEGCKDKNQQQKGGGPRYVVAIWGDEGLDMPLSLPSSPETGLFYNPAGDENSVGDGGAADWLAQLVNERHARNWNKINRFVEAVKSLDEGPVDVEGNEDVDGAIHGMDRVDLATNNNIGPQSTRISSGLPIPRSYDGESNESHWSMPFIFCSSHFC
jgi:tRNA(Phe) wybutosine-synthesizing methylase Tyw3